MPALGKELLAKFQVSAGFGRGTWCLGQSWKSHQDGVHPRVLRAGPNPHFSAVSEVTEKVETGSKLSMSPLPVSKLSECFSPLSLNVAVPFYSRPGTFIKRKPPNCIKAFISIFTKLPISFQPLCPSSPTLGCGLHACYPINIKHFPRGILCQIITTIRNTKVLCFVLKVTSLPLTHIQAWFLFCFTGF